jgi:hypothetical protein
LQLKRDPIEDENLMKKSAVIPTLLFTLALICALGASPALAYYAPMQNVTGPTVVGDTVTVSVHNPATGQDIAHTWSPPPGSGTIVIDQTHNVQGIVAWRVQDTTNNTFKIVWGVYDPGWKGNPDCWMFGETLWIDAISYIVAVNDGVVVYESEYSETNFSIQIWTYEPTQYFDHYYNGWMPIGWTSVSSYVGHSPHNYNVKDGVVAWVMDYEDLWSWVNLSIYDPHRTWQSLSIQTPINPSAPQIINATVTWSDTDGGQKWGYDTTNSWVKGADTKVMAYFEFWPTPGTGHQPVWFTDMSIGATSWKWTLGDGSVSEQRSLFHKYASAGNYVANQQVSGPNGTDAYNQTVPVDPGKGMAPNGPLMMLLLMDN